MTTSSREAQPEAGHPAPPRSRIVGGYVVLFGVLAVAVAVSMRAGRDLEPARSIAGTYRLEADSCLGDEGRTITVRQSGRYVDLDGPGRTSGRLELDGRRLTGPLVCSDGSSALLDATVAGDRDRSLVGRGGIRARSAGDRAEAGVAAAASAGKRSAEDTFGRLMLAIATIIVAGRLLGVAVAKAGQPRVMGEVLAGILLGPTLLGALAPQVQHYLFPPDIVPLLTAGADIGLAFYMFLVGLELDPKMLKGRVQQAALISHASIAIPISLGMFAAVGLFELVGPRTSFPPFALFIGIAMSITAFPVLARILLERRMLRRPVGAMAIGAAAVDDVTAWGLLALAAGVARTGGFGISLVKVVALAVAFCAVMGLGVRRLLARVADAYDEAGHVPAGWIGAIFVGVLLSAYVSSQIPIAAIFGAFVMGLIMPRRADLTHDVTRRVEDFVVTVLLPLFFVVAGLKTEIGLLNRPALWVLTLVLLAVAVVGKWTGGMGAAKLAGFGWRESAAIGALMNTRGLTELIVLNIGLELGVVTPALYTMLVLMALVTTFMTGPTLRAIDPSGTLGAPPESELREARAAPEAPERSIMVAPVDEKNTGWLVSLAEHLATTEPPHEVIVARLVDPGRAIAGLTVQDRELARATTELESLRAEMDARDVAVRVVAFTTATAGEDIVRLASEQEVDLLLIDGRRPLLGEGVPRGDVGVVLDRAPCDVAVLIERGAAPAIGPEHPVVVPFGGAEHDWAALELGAWLASATDAPLVLLGAEADERTGDRDASRLLASASLVVQQLAGVVARPQLVEPGRGVVRAAEGAGLVVVGLSDRWRKEGLGPVRSEIARNAPAPTLFVRRGTRPGALAPPGDHTRFTWSRSFGGPT